MPENSLELTLEHGINCSFKTDYHFQYEQKYYEEENGYNYSDIYFQIFKNVCQRFASTPEASSGHIYIYIYIYIYIDNISYRLDNMSFPLVNLNSKWMWEIDVTKVFI